MGDKSRIVVIDSDKSLVWGLVELLKIEGYDALGMTNGYAALEQLCMNPPDLVICDGDMLLTANSVVLDAIQADADLARIPYVMLTRATSMATYRQTQPAEYLRKPFYPEDLLNMIRSALSRRSMAEPELYGADETAG